MLSCYRINSISKYYDEVLLLIKFVQSIAVLLTASFAAATLLPLSESPQWWIRGMDFPRIHYLFAIVPLTALVCWILPPMSAGWHLRCF